MTILWFVIWFIANNVGGHEPLLFNPVNGWTGTLILAIALDLSAGKAVRAGRRQKESYAVFDLDVSSSVLGRLPRPRARSNHHALRIFT